MKEIGKPKIGEIPGENSVRYGNPFPNPKDIKVFLSNFYEEGKPYLWVIPCKVDVGFLLSSNCLPKNLTAIQRQYFTTIKDLISAGF